MGGWASAYNGLVLLRFAHETHDQPSYPWTIGVNGKSADDYVAALRHVRSISSRHDTANVRWIRNVNTMGDAPASRSAPVYGSLYPGDDAIDWLGLDVFNTVPEPDFDAPTWHSFDCILAQPYAALIQLSSRPIILADVGSTEFGGSKSAWIADAIQNDLTNYPPVRGIVWFDADKEQPWQLSRVLRPFARGPWSGPPFTGSADPE